MGLELIMHGPHACMRGMSGFGRSAARDAPLDCMGMEFGSLVHEVAQSSELVMRMVLRGTNGYGAAQSSKELPFQTHPFPEERVRGGKSLGGEGALGSAATKSPQRQQAVSSPAKLLAG